MTCLYQPYFEIGAYLKLKFMYYYLLSIGTCVESRIKEWIVGTKGRIVEARVLNFLHSMHFEVCVNSLEINSLFHSMSLCLIMLVQSPKGRGCRLGGF